MLTNYFSKQKDTNPEVKVCETKRCGKSPCSKQGKELTFSATNETFERLRIILPRAQWTNKILLVNTSI